MIGLGWVCDCCYEITSAQWQNLIAITLLCTHRMQPDHILDLDQQLNLNLLFIIHSLASSIHFEIANILQDECLLYIHKSYIRPIRRRTSLVHSTVCLESFIPVAPTQLWLLLPQEICIKIEENKLWSIQIWTQTDLSNWNWYVILISKWHLLFDMVLSIYAWKSNTIVGHIRNQSETLICYKWFLFSKISCVSFKCQANQLNGKNKAKWTEKIDCRINKMLIARERAEWIKILKPAKSRIFLHWRGSMN